ncbi:hypothetical protein [Chitinolyticbacter meiyuanensis]|uniref:hypothetical protein n=1 Tax=Chitinolyticbacter meiyuanensis TaxID=682798 RepID=UPI001C9E5C78|nr:hypothetical protein [Chitinolyticbacter meiyuanensis]
MLFASVTHKLDVETEVASDMAYVAPTLGLLDLSRQQRNLLLLRPLFALELSKQRIGEDGSLFLGIDTHYLALSALDQMMEGTTVSTGCTSDEVLTHIAGVAAIMKPALNKAELLKVAETVLAALDNKSNQYKEFAFEHFEAAYKGPRMVRFRLVTYVPDLEDIYRYKPTPEGYLVYLGMLDLAPEDAQELMEKMLDLLVQRGRFDAALEIAKRARTLSIEYRQLIRDKLHQAYRAPGTVNWTRDMGPGLDRARDHVRQRQAEDQWMEESVLEALRQAEEPRARTNLALLLKTLQGASMLRTQLVGDISGANDRFLESQRAVFRARRATGLPDLESRLLPQLIELPIPYLVKHAEHMLSAMYPPTQPRVYDLNSLFSLLLEQRAEDKESEEDDGEIKPYEPPPLQFDEAVIKQAAAWLGGKFSLGQSWRLDELLYQAEEAGFDWTMRRCLVLTLFRAYAHSESDFKNMRAEALEEFVADVARGTNLSFTPKGVHP